MNKKNLQIFLYLFFITILSYLIKLLIKYDLNHLTISNINLFNIGNIIVLILHIFILLFAFLLLFKKTEINLLSRTFLIILSTLSFLLLLSGYLILKLNVNFGEGYLFNYPVRKIITGALLFSSTIIEVYLLNLLLYYVFSKSNIIYLKAMLSTVIIFIIVFSTIFVFTTKRDFSGNSLKLSSERIGVVLGAAVWKHNEPSPILKGRIKKGVELLQKRKIAKIQFTGSNSPGELSEAKVAYLYAIKLGVKKQYLQFEETTTTTTEQIKFIKSNLVKNSRNPVVIISDQFHLARVIEISKFFGVRGIGVASDYHLSVEKLLYYRFRESIALLFFWLFAI